MSSIVKKPGGGTRIKSAAEAKRDFDKKGQKQDLKSLRAFGKKLGPAKKK